MPDVNYVAGMLGILLGVLGGITGVIGSLVKINRTRFLGALRVVLWLDITVGCILTVAGILFWFGSTTEYGHHVAILLFYEGGFTLGLIGAVSREILDEQSLIPKFAHGFLISGVVLLALVISSHSMETASRVTEWALRRGLTLLIYYALFLAYERIKLAFVQGRPNS